MLRVAAAVQAAAWAVTTAAAVVARAVVNQAELGRVREVWEAATVIVRAVHVVRTARTARAVARSAQALVTNGSIR